MAGWTCPTDLDSFFKLSERQQEAILTLYETEGQFASLSPYYYTAAQVPNIDNAKAFRQTPIDPLEAFSQPLYAKILARTTIADTNASSKRHKCLCENDTTETTTASGDTYSKAPNMVRSRPHLTKRQHKSTSDTSSRRMAQQPLPSSPQPIWNSTFRQIPQPCYLSPTLRFDPSKRMLVAPLHNQRPSRSPNLSTNKRRCCTIHSFDPSEALR